MYIELISRVSLLCRLRNTSSSLSWCDSQTTTFNLRAGWECSVLQPTAPSQQRQPKLLTLLYCRKEFLQDVILTQTLMLPEELLFGRQEFFQSHGLHYSPLNLPISDKEWTIWVYYDTTFKLWLLLQSAYPHHHLIKSMISLHQASKITLVNKGLASLKKNKFERAEHQFYGWSWASLASGYCNSFAFSCILNMK